MHTKPPPVPPLFSRKTPRGTPSAAGLKRQINAAIDAKSKPKNTYWQQLAEISASHPDTAKPPSDFGTLPEEELWLGENAKRAGVVVLPDGLQYEQISTATTASSRSPCSTAVCECHYRGMLTDGTEFDSSEVHGGPVNLQPGKMIEGWCVAMQLMAEGDHWRLYVPPHLAYGDAGRSDKTRGQYIPAGAALVFDLQINSIVSGVTKPKPVRPSVPADGSFVPSARFCGARPGHVFKAGHSGVGYYRDVRSVEAAPAAAALDDGTERPSGLTSATSAESDSGGGKGSGGARDDAIPSLPAAGGGGRLFERAPSPWLGVARSVVPPLAVLAQRDALTFSGKSSGKESSGKGGQKSAEEPSQASSEAGGAGERADESGEGLERRIQKERAGFEEAALDAVNTMLANLRLPTLQQALEDLGLPATGEKPELTARLTDSLASTIVSGRRA